MATEAVTASEKVCLTDCIHGLSQRKHAFVVPKSQRVRRGGPLAGLADQVH